MATRFRLAPLLWLLLLWPAIGWTVYTVLMVYADPFFWLARRGVEQGWSETLQDVANLGVLGLVVVVSGVVAFVAARKVAGFARWRDRAIAFTLASSAVGTLIFFWLSPVIYAGALRDDVTVAGQFIFGPYPHPKDLEYLAERGFTVVSLLDADFTLIEDRLIDEEERAAEELGMNYVHIPITPWAGLSASTRTELEALAWQEGPFYVHCFLGRHRAQDVRPIVTGPLGIDLSVGDRVQATDEVIAAVTYLKANGFHTPLEQLGRAALLLGPTIATLGVLAFAYVRRRRV